MKSKPSITKLLVALLGSTCPFVAFSQESGTTEALSSVTTAATMATTVSNELPWSSASSNGETTLSVTSSSTVYATVTSITSTSTTGSHESSNTSRDNWTTRSTSTSSSIAETSIGPSSTSQTLESRSGSEEASKSLSHYQSGSTYVPNTQSVTSNLQTTPDNSWSQTTSTRSSTGTLHTMSDTQAYISSSVVTSSAEPSSWFSQLTPTGLSTAPGTKTLTSSSADATSVASSSLIQGPSASSTQSVVTGPIDTSSATFSTSFTQTVSATSTRSDSTSRSISTPSSTIASAMSTTRTVSTSQSIMSSTPSRTTSTTRSVATQKTSSSVRGQSSSSPTTSSSRTTSKQITSDTSLQTRTSTETSSTLETESQTQATSIAIESSQESMSTTAEELTTVDGPTHWYGTFNPSPTSKPPKEAASNDVTMIVLIVGVSLIVVGGSVTTIVVVVRRRRRIRRRDYRGGAPTEYGQPFNPREAPSSLPISSLPDIRSLNPMFSKNGFTNNLTHSNSLDGITKNLVDFGRTSVKGRMTMGSPFNPGPQHPKHAAIMTVLEAAPVNQSLMHYPLSRAGRSLPELANRRRKPRAIKWADEYNIPLAKSTGDLIENALLPAKKPTRTESAQRILINKTTRPMPPVPQKPVLSDHNATNNVQIGPMFSEPRLEFGAVAPEMSKVNGPPPNLFHNPPPYSIRHHRPPPPLQDANGFVNSADGRRMQYEQRIPSMPNFSQPQAVQMPSQNPQSISRHSQTQLTPQRPANPPLYALFPSSDEQASSQAATMRTQAQGSPQPMYKQLPSSQMLSENASMVPTQNTNLQMMSQTRLTSSQPQLAPMPQQQVQYPKTQALPRNLMTSHQPMSSQQFQSSQTRLQAAQPHHASLQNLHHETRVSNSNLSPRASPQPSAAHPVTMRVENSNVPPKPAHLHDSLPRISNARGKFTSTDSFKTVSAASDLELSPYSRADTPRHSTEQHAVFMTPEQRRRVMGRGMDLK